MTIHFTTNTSKRVALIFVDVLAWTGWAIGLTVFASALFPQFERQVEDYVGYYALSNR